MIKKLKMTDISAHEVETELGYIRYCQMISPKVYEKNGETILECEVNDSNKMVFASVFQALSEYVYTDEDETPFERFSNLVAVRKLNVGIIDQGFRGKFVKTLVSSKCPIKMSVYFDNESDLYKYFNSSDQEEILYLFAKAMNLDVVIMGTAEFEDDGLVSSLSKIYVWNQGALTSNSYYLFGTADDISEKLTFLAAAFADKKIY